MTNCANAAQNAAMVVFQKLQAWQDEHNVSDEELAVRVSREVGRDIHRTTISRGKRGQRVLGMELQLAIQKITKAASPSEWAEFYAQTVHLRGAGASKGKKKQDAGLVREAV